MGELTLERCVGADITVSASYLYSKRQAPADVRRHEPEPAELDRSSTSCDGASRGTFPFFRGARPDANINNAIKVADSRRIDLPRAGAAGEQAVQQGASLQRELHAVEVRGHRPELDDVHFELRDDGQSRSTTKARRGRHRSTGGIAACRASTTRPTTSAASRSAAPARSRAACRSIPTISGGVVAATGAPSTTTTNGTGASNRAPFETRNSFRQTGRKTSTCGSPSASVSAAARQIDALWEAFNIVNWTNYTASARRKYRVASSSYDAATNKATVNLTEDAGLLRADRRQQHALRTARHADRPEVPLVDA